ncbi:MAG: sigma 54-interacting transcriptional regulator [Pseudomonadota bacterium]|nr:sigma 54-interacting transcriptional regulator [Pseudomonadota bacterium]
MKDLNITAMIRVSQAISSEIDFDKLLSMLITIMVENAGAQSVYLILESDGKLLVEACGTTEQGSLVVSPPIPYEKEDLSGSIIRHVARSREVVVLDDAVKDARFNNDPHIKTRQVKSVLCVPILHKTKMVGIFYLENSLVAGVFTSLKLEMMKIISSQIAISIENARLFDQVKKGETKYRSIYENAVEGIFQVSHEGKIVSINPSFARTLGYESEEDMKRSIDTVGLDLYADPGQRQEFSRLLMENDVINGFEVEFCRKDRSRIWVSMHARPVYDSPGKLKYVEGIITDITEQRRHREALQESEKHLRHENLLLRSNIKDRYKFSNIIGKSPAMQSVYELILNASTTDANVAVYGESGTGKELVARAIHDNSRRNKNSFIPVNCGAIPQNLFESEFFGYKKGAFTGAVRDKGGFLSQADGGTLFLDEIGELELNNQVKLLRALEGGGYIPVGGSVLEQPDVRIIAATNRDLQELVKKGLMREDFFYRIHIIPISLPPLRERKEDIPLLIEHFIKEYGSDGSNGKGAILPLSLKAQKTMYNHQWPGNIRELQNTIHRYITLRKFDFTESSGGGEVDSVGDNMSTAELADCDGASYKELLEKFEKRVFLKALEKHQWHREKAAISLGLPRRTFFRKLSKIGLVKE